MADLNRMAFFGPWNPSATYTKTNCFLFKNNSGKVVTLDIDQDGKREEFDAFIFPSLEDLAFEQRQTISDAMLAFKRGDVVNVKNLYEKNPTFENMSGKDDCWTSWKHLSSKYPTLRAKLEILIPTLRAHGSTQKLLSLAFPAADSLQDLPIGQLGEELMKLYNFCFGDHSELIKDELDISMNNKKVVNFLKSFEKLHREPELTTNLLDDFGRSLSSLPIVSDFPFVHTTLDQFIGDKDRPLICKTVYWSYMEHLEYLLTNCIFDMYPNIQDLVDKNLKIFRETCSRYFSNQNPYSKLWHIIYENIKKHPGQLLNDPKINSVCTMFNSNIG